MFFPTLSHFFVRPRPWNRLIVAYCSYRPLQQTITWYRVHSTGGQAYYYSLMTGQSRFILEDVTFFCSPVWWILYHVIHVIVCCKKTIAVHCRKVIGLIYKRPKRYLDFLFPARLQVKVLIIFIFSFHIKV